jgi:hypothetical protein
MVGAISRLEEAETAGAEQFELPLQVCRSDDAAF